MKTKSLTPLLHHLIEENRQFTGYYRKLTIPPTPKGNQRLSSAPKVGDKVITLSTATVKAGLTSTVKEVYEENGFVYIVTSDFGTQRSQDVAVIK
jgi:hypothetical protein